jgi:hypothetical protein
VSWYLLSRRRAGRRDASPRLLRRLLLSAIDLQRRPPSDSRSGTTSVRRAVGSFRRPEPPRELSLITVKRTNPRFGRFGHWWVEIDGVESYGWWPGRCPLRVRDFLPGGGGALNGLGGSCAGGNSSRDPHHLESAEHEFHPVLTARKSDRRVRSEIRSFASGFDGGWRWSSKPQTDDCRTFQVRLMRAVGLAEPLEHRASRGRGCPFLALFKPRARELV